MKRKNDSTMNDECEIPQKVARVSTRVVLNKCFGGFGLSKKAKELLMSTLEIAQYDDRTVDEILNEIPRHHPALIYVVEHLGTEVWVPFHLDQYINRVFIVEIPIAENDYEVRYQDGWETAVPKNFENVIFPRPVS